MALCRGRSSTAAWGWPWGTAACRSGWRRCSGAADRIPARCIAWSSDRSSGPAEPAEDRRARTSGSRCTAESGSRSDWCTATSRGRDRCRSAAGSYNARSRTRSAACTECPAGTLRWCTPSRSCRSSHRLPAPDSRPRRIGTAPDTAPRCCGSSRRIVVGSSAAPSRRQSGRSVHRSLPPRTHS